MEGLVRVASPGGGFSARQLLVEQDKLSVATGLLSSSAFQLEQAERAAVETPRHRQDWAEGAPQTPRYRPSGRLLAVFHHPALFNNCT